MKKYIILLWTLLKYILKYFIRIIQIVIVSVVIIASLYLIYISLHFTYSTIIDIDYNSDLIVKGIPILTIFIFIGAGILFIFAIKTFYILCFAFLMIINGSLGDIIEHLNVTNKNDNYSGYLIFRKGGMSEIYNANQHTRRYFLKRWWKRF